MDTKQFGAFIAQCRKEKGMTQAQLAEKLHVTDKAVSRWERGLGFPDIGTLEPLAGALGVSVLELMKSRRLPAETRLPSREVEGLVLDTLNAVKQQHKQEWRNTALVFRFLFVVVIVFLFLDSIYWDPEKLFFTLAGVAFPLFCVGGFVVLAGYGVWRKATGKTYGRTFLAALSLFGALALLAGLLFLAGALGAGPVPS